jgi:hypothetical protein
MNWGDTRVFLLLFLFGVALFASLVAMLILLHKAGNTSRKNVLNKLAVRLGWAHAIQGARDDLGIKDFMIEGEYNNMRLIIVSRFIKPVFYSNVRRGTYELHFILEKPLSSTKRNEALYSGLSGQLVDLYNVNSLLEERDNKITFRLFFQFQRSKQIPVVMGALDILTDLFYIADTESKKNKELNEAQSKPEIEHNSVEYYFLNANPHLRLKNSKEESERFKKFYAFKSPDLLNMNETEMCAAGIALRLIEFYFSYDRYKVRGITEQEIRDALIFCFQQLSKCPEAKNQLIAFCDDPYLTDDGRNIATSRKLENFVRSNFITGH